MAILSRANAGLANGATAVDIQELADAAKAATVVNGKKCAGTFRSQVGETKLACAGRADLEVRERCVRVSQSRTRGGRPTSRFKAHELSRLVMRCMRVRLRACVHA